MNGDATADDRKSLCVRPSMRDILLTFSLIGVTSFGGGAVIGLIQDCIVRRRRWLTDCEFIEALVLGQSLPGPIAANTIAYIGYQLRGVFGAATALFFYVFPSFCLMVFFAALYERLREAPIVNRLFFGLNPAVAGLIAATALQLGKKSLLAKWQRIQCVGVFLLVFFAPRLALPLILASAFGGAVATRSREKRAISRKNLIRNSATLTLLLCGVGLIAWLMLEEVKTGTIEDNSGPLVNWLVEHRLAALAWISFKLGAITFGGGYVMVPLLEHDVLTRMGWLSHREFADGMAMGALTPGPFVIVATFIGYRVAGLPGALTMTLGIFCAPFLLTVWAAHSIQRFRQNALLQGALKGVCPTGIALLASAATVLARSFPSASPSLIVAVTLMTGSVFLLMKYALNPLYILFASTLIGYFFAP